jgi:hypothetical protein
LKASQKTETFFRQLKDLQEKINRVRSKTISTREFKEESTKIYETWLAEIQPVLQELEIRENVHSRLDELFEALRYWANMRVTEVSSVKEVLNETVDRFFKDIILSIKKIEPLEPTANLMDAASFLSLNTDWSVATCALQLQEVSIKLVAEKSKIDLSKTNVERLLNAKIPSSDFSFNHQYEAFGKEVKRLFKIDMPFLTTQFRRMRVKVLHEGYNPEPEEKDSLVSFTIGLLKKLEDICSKTEDIKNKQKEVKETTNEDLEKIKKDVKELKEKEDMRVSG